MKQEDLLKLMLYHIEEIFKYYEGNEMPLDDAIWDIRKAEGKIKYGLNKLIKSNKL